MAERNIATLDATPGPLQLDLSATAVLVVDMQNDFGAAGGMFDRAGIDISVIRWTIAPTAKVIAAARTAGLPVIYVKEEHPRGAEGAGRRRHAARRSRPACRAAGAGAGQLSWLDADSATYPHQV